MAVNAENGATYDYDLVTIGAGSGGVRASRFAAQLYNAKVAVVELPFGFVSSENIGGAGGTCVIRGCVPKKLLVYASQFSEEFQDAVGFGWSKAEPPIDWQKLMASKSKEIARLNGVYNGLLSKVGVDYVEGRGHLLDAHTVEVDLPGGGTKKLTAKNILVATGGYATKAPIEGSEHAITSDEALALENLPTSSILVVGAGYIAVEFAGIFNGVGADVHLMFRADKPLRGFDEECRAQVAENLEKKGIKVYAETLPTKITKNSEGDFTVTYRHKPDGAEQTLNVGLVMLATGRKPKSKGLGLEEAGVKLSEQGAVVVDDISRTSVPNIYAIGDVTDRINLTPVALMEGMAVARTMFGDAETKADYEWVPSAVFCRPPLATVGYSEERAASVLSGTIDVYTSKFKPMKYTLSGRDERTFMKLIVHAESNRVVGVHMVGPDAPEILQGVAVAIKAGATKAHFDSTIGIHPSAAEEFVTMRSKTRSVACTGSCKL